ncbi:MAG: Hsp20/alpha crystallin family protein [Thermodesulfovibrionales bacterium]|nr:Hsp20/alpha crystallin family protein [Thermodesulfovibrionales bacterium]
MELKFQCFTLYETEISGSEPPLDIYETDDFLNIDIDLPGIEPEKVLIKVINDILIIEGIRLKEPEEDRRYLCMERRKEAFRRIIKLPVEIEARNGKALYQNGVILLRFPKIKSEVVKIKIFRESDQ